MKRIFTIIGICLVSVAALTVDYITRFIKDQSGQKPALIREPEAARTAWQDHDAVDGIGRLRTWNCRMKSESIRQI